LNHAEEIARLQPFVERARDFSGWDLGFIDVRLLDPGPPWDYEALAAGRVRHARQGVDFGTAAARSCSEYWSTSRDVMAHSSRPNNGSSTPP